MAVPSMTMVVRTAPATRRLRRSMFNVRPAMNAISVVAMPFTVEQLTRIDSVITLPRYGPISSPNNR